MGQCESCVNTSKTAKGQNLSYGQGKKRRATNKLSGSRKGSFTTSDNGGKCLPGIQYFTPCRCLTGNKMAI